MYPGDGVYKSGACHALSSIYIYLLSVTFKAYETRKLKGKLMSALGFSSSMNSFPNALGLDSNTTQIATC